MWNKDNNADEKICPDEEVAYVGEQIFTGLSYLYN